jgi:hypothetical protein
MELEPAMKLTFSRFLTALIPVVALAAAGYLLCRGPTSTPQPFSFRPEICTNTTTHVTETWRQPNNSKGAIEGTQSVSGTITKSGQPPSVDPRTIVINAINAGLDPHVATQELWQFTITDAVHASAAEKSRALSVATYGWNCHWIAAS